MSIILDGTSGITTPADSISGNLNFTGTGNRITGDFSNGTAANRVAVQTSTTNSNTIVEIIPNGTSTSSALLLESDSALTNGSFLQFTNDNVTTSVRSGVRGTGTYIPMTFYTNNTEQMRIATDGTITGTKGNLQLISGTAVASTSGTSIDFTGIPSWVKRITVMFNGVSTNGTSKVLIQVGSGSATTSGYNSAAVVNNNANSTGLDTSTAGFILESGGPSATTLRYGQAIISHLGSNVWTIAYNGYLSVYGFAGCASGASPALSGALDRIRITTVNGTDTFDAGSINILYE